MRVGTLCVLGSIRKGGARPQSDTPDRGRSVAGAALIGPGISKIRNADSTPRRGQGAAGCNGRGCGCGRGAGALLIGQSGGTGGLTARQCCGRDSVVWEADAECEAALMRGGILCPLYRCEQYIMHHACGDMVVVVWSMEYGHGGGALACAMRCARAAAFLFCCLPLAAAVLLRMYCGMYSYRERAERRGRAISDA